MDDIKQDKTEYSELLNINKKQIEFYNTPPDKRKYNIAMQLWRNIRRPMNYVMSNTGMWNDIYKMQWGWMGDLSDKKVLDFGCYSGNALSLQLAKSSKGYIGVDLSEPAINQLNASLLKNNVANSKAFAVDILSDEFNEQNFDVIYAQGVFHHFKHLDIMLEKLTEILKPGGIVVTCDPLQVAITSRIVRALYRPFQTNSEWEWPFTKNTFTKISDYFEISKIQGFMGYSKWSLPVAILNKNIALKAAKNLHYSDMKYANKMDKSLWRCLQVIMKLRKLK